MHKRFNRVIVESVSKGRCQNSCKEVVISGRNKIDGRTLRVGELGDAEIGLKGSYGNNEME